MPEDKDWNAIFAERKAARDLGRAEALSEAKLAAAHTAKERFSARTFKKLYTRRMLIRLLRYSSPLSRLMCGCVAPTMT